MDSETSWGIELPPSNIRHHGGEGPESSDTAPPRGVCGGEEGESLEDSFINGLYSMTPQRTAGLWDS